MNQQTVYLPCEASEAVDTVLGDLKGFYIKPTTGYFFTPDEFREVAFKIWDDWIWGIDFQTFYNQLTGAGE